MKYLELHLAQSRCSKMLAIGTGNMTRWLRTLSAIAEDPGLVLSTHITAYQSSSSWGRGTVI